MRILLLLFCFAGNAYALDRITALVTFVSPTTNGMTMTVNGATRTWTNSVFVPSTQILTNASAAGAKSNAFDQIALNPFAQISIFDNDSTSFKLAGASGAALTVTLLNATGGGSYGTVAYTTQTVASAVGVRVPITIEPTAGQQANIASLLVKGENDLSTNSFYENSVAMINFLGLTNAQTISGAKQFTNSSGIWSGAVSNSAEIRGTISWITNGVWSSGTANNLTITNGTFYACAFSNTNNFPAGADLAFGRFAVSSLANGNNASVPVGTNVFAEVSGPTAAFTINGISGSPNRDGKFLIILNQTGFNMTIAHDSGVDATAGNRIFSMTGADRTTTGNGSALLIYSGAASRWILLSFDP